MSEVTKRVLISGKVQGVWFRAWTVEQATRLHLRGWVRNRKDGRVEALIAGPSHIVDDLVELCHQGPPMAKVESVEVETSGETAPEAGFGQRPTA